MMAWHEIELNRLVHEGELTEVWLGRWADGGGPRLAVKRANGGSTAEALAALEREGELLTEFRHPQVVELVDVVAVPGRRKEARATLGLVLEPADSGSLVEVRRRTGGLAPEAVAAVLSAAAVALRALHEGGIVHGDVSPANLLYDRARGPLLADFGSALAVGAAPGAGGRATPGFAAPEVGPGWLAHPRGDIFALGATALWLLARLAPRQPGEGVRAGPLTGVLLRATQRDERRRHQSVSQLLTDLDESGAQGDELALGRQISAAHRRPVGSEDETAAPLLTKRFGPAPPRRVKNADRRRGRVRWPPAA